MARVSMTRELLLTARQRECLTHIAHGFTYKEVAWIMTVSEQTIKNHMTETLRRLDARNSIEALIVVGWLTPPMHEHEHGRRTQA
jgi:DNA-binding NarL/FixJ family response regulator